MKQQLVDDELEWLADYGFVATVAIDNAIEIETIKRPVNLAIRPGPYLMFAGWLVSIEEIGCLFAAVVGNCDHGLSNRQIRNALRFCVVEFGVAAGQPRIRLGGALGQMAVLFEPR